MKQSRIIAEAARLKPLGEEVLGRYDMLVKSVDHLATHSNVMYRVVSDDGRQMVLRMGTPQANSRTNIEYEVDWLAALARDTDLDLVSPLPTAGGRKVTNIWDSEIGADRHCVLFTWVPGAPLGEGAGSFGYRLMGQISAQLHRHGASWMPEDRQDLRHWNRIFYYDEELDPVIIFGTRHDHLFDRKRRSVIEKSMPIVDKVIAATWVADRPQIVHGDLHEWNVHVVGTRMYAFDFEDVMFATPAQDVSISLYSSRTSRRKQEVRAAFQAGFEEYSTWPIHDEEQLDGLHAARQIMLMNFAARSLPEAEADDFLQKVMPWMESYLKRYG